VRGSGESTNRRVWGTCMERLVWSIEDGGI
jgi:hypothetical protein